jgi:hypothetical protein
MTKGKCGVISVLKKLNLASASSSVQNPDPTTLAVALPGVEDGALASRVGLLSSSICVEVFELVDEVLGAVDARRWALGRAASAPWAELNKRSSFASNASIRLHHMSEDVQ